MTIQVVYRAADNQTAVRETHTDEKDAHYAAGFNTTFRGFAHWVVIDGETCEDCTKYANMKGRVSGLRRKLVKDGAAGG